MKKLGAAAILAMSASSQSFANWPTTTPDNVNFVGAVFIIIDPLANDTGNGLILNPPNPWSQKGGQVELSNNKLIYRAKANFNGEDKIWYTIRDDQGRTNSGVVTINVSENSTDNIGYGWPTTTPDNVNVFGSRPVLIDALANDRGSELTLDAPNPWSLKGGRVSLSDNKIVYRPKFGFNGEDKIWYTMRDFANRSNTGVVTLNVSENNTVDPDVYPTAQLDLVNAIAGVQTTIDVLANDTGFNLVLNAPNAWSQRGGTVSLSNNKLLYKAKSSFVGIDKIWYTFKDSRGRTNNGEVNITVTRSPNPPVARDDVFSTFVNTPIVVDVFGNDILDGPGPFTFGGLSSTSANGGTVRVQDASRGKVFYEPRLNFRGTDSFWYVIRNNSGQTSRRATVSMTVR